MLTAGSVGAAGAGSSSGVGPEPLGMDGVLSSVLTGAGASPVIAGAPVISSSSNGQTILDAARMELPFGLDRFGASPISPLEIHETSMKLETTSEELDAANKVAVENQTPETTTTEPEEKDIGSAQLDAKIVEQSEEMADVQCAQANPDPE